MSLPLEFGRRYTLDQAGNVTTVLEEVFVGFDTKKRHQLNVETIRIKDEKDMLAEFLKLLDRYKAGEVDMPGIQMLRDKSSGQLRVEKIWVDLTD